MPRNPSKFVSELSPSDREFLENTWKQHPTHTVRCRAQAILLSSEGYTVSQLQGILRISKPTALGWIDRWQLNGRNGLYDAARPGGPPILNTSDREILQEELERSPHQPRRVMQAVQQRTGKQFSEATLRWWARRLQFRWKRMRQSLRRKRDERQFRLAQEHLDHLRTLPGVTIAFFDEAAFSLQGVVPYGWQRIGERCEVPVGERGCIQVLGIEEQDGVSRGYLHQGSVTGRTVEAVLEDYSQCIDGPTILILDNASVHTCGLIERRMEDWNERGLYFYFLPESSPELNDIERLWDRLKHHTFPVDAWSSLRSLLDNLRSAFHDLGEAINMPSVADVTG